MTDREEPKTAGERPVFPYDILWPGYGNADVRLWELLEIAGEFRILNEAAEKLEQSAGFVTELQVRDVLARHGVPADEATAFWAICSFYLAPRQAAAFDLDTQSSRDTLLRAARYASRLAEELGKLPPKVVAALYYIRPTIDEVIIRQGGPFHPLWEEVSDFAKVAQAAADDLSGVEGRPTEHLRDTMFRLLLEQIEEAGMTDLRISNGTSVRPDPHLAGKAGDLLLELIHLVEPLWSEHYIAPRLKLVRSKLRKQRRQV